MVDTAEGSYRPIWKNRRRVIFGSLFYCAGQLAYLAALGADTRVNEMIVLGSFVLAGGVIGSYVFGAVWDDKNYMESLKQ